MRPDALLRIAMPRQTQRARIGLHLNGPMPTIRELQQKHQLGKSAACKWHSLLAQSRREFGTSHSLTEQP